PTRNRTNDRNIDRERNIVRGARGAAVHSERATVAGGNSMVVPTTLDELDVKILRLLNTDARKSYRDIAKATDASISTVSSRVRKLEDVGGITGYVPVPSEARLGH